MASLSFLATLLVCITGLILLAIHFYFLKTCQPEQISLACTGNPTEMMITWVTFKPTVNHTVQYNVHGEPLSLNATGTMKKFTDGGWEHRVLFIHKTKLTGLTPDQTYGNPTEMMITWVTFKPTVNHTVQYNVHGEPLSLNATGTMKKFTDGGWEHRVLFIHKTKLTGLTPDQAYDYRCGGDNFWSDVYTFKTLRSGESWSPRLAVYGDLGTDGQSLPFLKEEAEQGNFDVILHVGDFAYDMHSHNARVGDKFMNQIQPIAARVPYMTCPGNHDTAYNFSNYKNRFSMPGKNMFYSWNIGPAHIISISTEFYFRLQYGSYQIGNQYRWLEADLKEATTWINRAKRPWIITMGHRPMYCSNDDGDDCAKKESVVRTGLHSKYGLEDLLYKYGVDLMIWAHEHSYERLYPVYNQKLCKGPSNEPYTNPCAPVHIITGSAGCREHHDSFYPKYGPWTAFRALDYGYTRMIIHNNTHLYLEQVSVDKGGQVIDDVWIVKHRHGPHARIRPMK